MRRGRGGAFEVPQPTDAAPSCDGVQIRYETHGEGAPAIVFVHGWSCDRTYWNEQVAFFAASRQVVTLDLAGHGESGLGRVGWTMPAFGRDVAAVVDTLQLPRVILVGHSMGADVVTEAAVELGERVVGVVWVDTWAALGESRSPAEIETFVAGFRDDFPSATRDFVRRMFPASADPELVERVALDMSSAPPDVALAALEQAVSNGGPILATLASVRAPVLAVNADNRPIDGESLRRHGVEPVIMHGVGHFLMLEKPAAFNALLSETLERIAA